MVLKFRDSGVHWNDILVYFEINVFFCGPPFMSVPQLVKCVTVFYFSSLSGWLGSSWRLFLTIGNRCLQFLIPAHYVKFFNHLTHCHSEEWHADTRAFLYVTVQYCAGRTVQNSSKEAQRAYFPYFNTYSV